jgi:DNA-directed RNA polymerase subunit RPC12/RpoP
MAGTEPSSKVFRCPKCGTHFEPPRDARSECPKCGIWFHKWKSVSKRQRMKRAETPEEPSLDEIVKVQALPENPFVLYGQAATLLFISLWGLLLITKNYHTDEIDATFMHAIFLPIHEAGHILFLPFGEFMHFLGGSLFQIALPFGIAYAFHSRQGDSFGAAVCLWWGGASLVDLSPYIWDALDPVLPLAGGSEHDWVYLLGRFGLIDKAHTLAMFVHHAGALLMVMGVLWATSFLYDTRKTKSWLAGLKK